VIDVRRYLDRLRVADPGPPSAAGLVALHRAQVEQIAYEALDIQIRRPTSIDPLSSVARVLRGRGGYCYHLNSAFGALLSGLGYRVTWHRAAVQNRGAPPPGIDWANHLALTVEIDGEAWLVDAGLGDALHEPLPLRAGVYRQGPFAFRLGRSPSAPGGWRLDHDPRGAFAGMDFEMAPATVGTFAERHRYLSTSPESSFVRTSVVMRRDAGGVDSLTGCVLRRIDASGDTRLELASSAEWYAALADVFGLALTDMDGQERAALWTRVRAIHDAWRARQTGP
jgi:N-hydroxyarylamine O-acetyltransferase